MVMFGVNPCIRIEVPITNEKDRQTYFGALNYQSKEFHVQSHPSGDGKSTVKFIKYLQNIVISNKKETLLSAVGTDEFI
jgi:putative transposase